MKIELKTVLAALLILQSEPMAGTFIFDPYGATFQVPNPWVVQSRSTSNITFKLTTGKTLKVEFLPDASPESHVMSRIALLEKENTRFRILEYGPAYLPEHWGYWFASSQINPMVSKEWRFQGIFIRIPSKSAVVSLQYINYYPESPDWERDMLTMDGVAASFTIAGDDHPNRYGFKDSVPIGMSGINLFHSRNFKSVRSTNGLALTEDFDRLFSSAFTFASLSDTADKGFLAFARKEAAASLRLDTSTFGADPEGAAYDTTYVEGGDTVFEQAHTYGRDAYFPGFRYSRLVRHGDAMVWSSFTGPNLYLSYMDYINTVMAELRAPGRPAVAVGNGVGRYQPRKAGTIRKMLAAKGVVLDGRRLRLPGPRSMSSR